jgi:putative transposase
MQLTYKFNYYKNFSKLHDLCVISKNIYNQGNYLVKQELDKNHKWLRYNDLDKILKITKNLEDEVNYKLLKAQTSQQIIKTIDNSWNSYFKSLKEFKKNPGKFKGLPKAPKYKEKINQLIFTNQNSKIKGNKLYLYKDLIIVIPEYRNRKFENFNTIRIIPRKDHHTIEIVYTVPDNEIVKNSNIIGIDLGVNNFATLTSNTFNNPVIFSGKILKSINQNYNKKISKLSSIKDKMKIKKQTKRIQKITERRNRRLQDIEHKISKKIVEIAQNKNVSTIVVGKNKNWKTNSNLGNKNNQAFVMIPHARFITKLNYKCKMNGITLIETEESYTSKTDNLVLEELCNQEQFKGKRIKRGLFQSSSGKLINSDVNGSLGIIRKVVGNSRSKEIIDRGNLLTPFKIRNIFDVQTLNKVRILKDFNAN